LLPKSSEFPSTGKWPVFQRFVIALLRHWSSIRVNLKEGGIIISATKRRLSVEGTIFLPTMTNSRAAATTNKPSKENIQ
jgi:hypothetical protein